MQEFEATPLEVVLNGGRDYVQGTQLIACAARVMAEQGMLEGPTMVQAAAFHTITDRVVSLQSGMPQKGADVLGTVTFNSSTLGKQHAHFLSGKEEAPRADIPPMCSYDLIEATGPLDASFALDGVSDTEQFLVALIQTVKGRHQALTDTVSDVWFTGLRGATIPVAEPFVAQSGTLSLSFRRLMNTNDRWQTLMSFSMANPDGSRVLDGTLTFAFKSETKPDVD